MDRREDATPYRTGAHEQVVRRLHSRAEGLPSGPVQAVAASRDGSVFAVADGRLARLGREPGSRWVTASEPAAPTALAAPRSGPELLAGCSDGLWEYTRGAWRPVRGGPLGVVAFSEAADGTLYALTAHELWMLDGPWRRIAALPEGAGTAQRLAAASEGGPLVLAAAGLYRLVDGRFRPVRPRAGGAESIRHLAALGAGTLLLATNDGLRLVSRGEDWLPLRGADGLPLLDLTHVTTAPDGTVWLGSPQGVVRWRGGEWRLFAGPRWLPDDRVTCLATGPDGSAWVGTEKGLSRLEPRRLTLEEKSELYQRDLERRDRRFGYVTVIQLRQPGVLEGGLQEISDNDGLWTAMYVGSQCFRYAATKSAAAKAQAWRSMQAILRLESITGHPGFPARAISKIGEPNHENRSRGEWHPSPVEPGWMWKGDTSSDEIDGHFFAFYVFHELAADAEQKRRVRETCRRVTDHLLDHGYYLVDLDGKHTRWGVWAPEQLNDNPEWEAERGLNSLEMLSYLKVAHHLVGDPRYAEAYRSLIRDHGYALNMVNTKVVPPGEVNHSDDELAFLSYYPLLQLETDPALRALYVASLRRSWEYERVEASPLWSFIYGACTGEPCDVEASVQALQEIPLDLVKWPTRNSHRADLHYDPVPDRFGKRQLLRPLPWTERPLHKWNGNPFVVDGGDGGEEEDQTMWLLPYWLGRYHRLIS